MHVSFSIMGAAGLSLAALAALAADPSPEPEIVLRGRHVDVVVHFDPDEAARPVVAVADAAFKTSAALMGPVPSAAGRPRVHLYRDAWSYRQVEARITGGRFARNNAFSDHASLEAHVAVQPDIIDAVLKRVGVPPHTLRLVAHEVSHLTTFRTWPGYRDHPDWFSEGSATWVADEVARAAAFSAGVLADPHTSTRAARLRRLLAEGGLPHVRAIVAGDLDGLDRNERYAVWWGLFRFLHAEQRTRLRKLLAVARPIDGESGFARALVRAFESVFEDVGLDALDGAFAESVEALAPQWDEQLRSLATAGKAWPHLAFGSGPAVAWRAQAPARGAYDVRGRIEILDAGERRAAVLLGRSAASHVAVRFIAGFGLDVVEQPAKGDARTLASVPLRGFAVDRPLAFRLRVDGAKLDVRVDGRRVVRVETALTDGLAGAWGLRVPASGAALWSRVKGP